MSNKIHIGLIRYVLNKKIYIFYELFFCLDCCLCLSMTIFVNMTRTRKGGLQLKVGKGVLY